MTKALALSACVILSGCEEDEFTEVDAGVLYGMGMCEFKIQIDDNDDDFDDSALAERVRILINQDATLQGYINTVCNLKTPRVSTFNFTDYNPEPFFGNNSDGEPSLMKGLPGSFQLPGTFETMKSLQHVILGWNEAGVTYNARIIGSVGNARVDILFNLQDGWVNSRRLVEKQFMNSLSASQFDQSVNRPAFLELFIQDFIDLGKQSELHDLIFSYTTLSSQEVKAPFLYKGALTNLVDANSPIPNISYTLDGGEVVLISDVKLQTFDVGGIKTIATYDITRDNDEVIQDVIWNSSF